jgi:hypothetical protein
VVSVIVPACPEITLKGPTGAMDKLLVRIPMFDIRDKSMYKAWLQPEGKGIFISMPATGGWLFKERANHFNVNKQFPADQDQFQPRCQRTYDAYERMMEGKTDDVHNTMTVYWDFPQDTICSNAQFNKDNLGASQTNPFVLDGLIHLKAATDPTNGVFNRDDADCDKNSSITVTNQKNNKRVRINQPDNKMGNNEQDNKMGDNEQDNKMGEDDDNDDSKSL